MHSTLDLFHRPARKEKKCTTTYSHLSNKLGGWNKREGGAKKLKSINVEVGITVEVGIFRKINNRGGWIFFSKTTLIHT